LISNFGKRSVPKWVNHRISAWNLGVLVVIFVFLVGRVEAAQMVSDTAGLSMPLNNTLGSARSAVMGPAFLAVADDGSALFANPAGLGGLSSAELSLHHQTWLADTSQDTFLAALPVEGLGGVGLAAHYLDYGTFQGRDSSGTPTSDFSANQTAFQLGWGRDWGGHLFLGIGLLAAQQNLGGRSYTAVFSNGGLLFQPSAGFSLGLAYSGMGSNGLQGNLPFAMAMGAACRPELSTDWSLLIAGATSVEEGGINRIQFGAEGVFQGLSSVRAGYQLNLVDNQLGGVSGLTLGAGFKWRGLSLDYAFLPMGDLGASHQVSLSYFFNTVSASGPKPLAISEKPVSSSPETVMAPGLLSARTNPTTSGPVSTASVPPGDKTTLALTTNLSQAPPASPEGDELEIQFQLSPDTVNQGRELEMSGKYPEAISLYTQAIQTDQKNLLAWWGLGNIYYRLGKKDYAIQCFEQVLRIKPGSKPLAEWLEKYRSTPASSQPSQP